ncbi:MAG TPA: ABC transporter permease [Methanoregulaceae archaeon]|nr:MAG: ABC transporter permease [Methanolinea sp.]HON82103.1 ABC transporter permease [Methanoregulaceae archaeon]HPD10801.1 ABC transporter permease [Methanoregulaceae archaeon]HRT15989.1 ABC transporter permease [Methanoregulaceae archaeon]HRU31454.1 ABC transporter permease [Methanoregulaceae archaeon]
MWIIEYYDLIRILAISDLRVKYQSSVLGFLWSLLNPFLMLMVLYVVFSRLFTTSGPDFILFLFVGITSYRFFSNGTTASVSSIVAKTSLVMKVYIPREVLVFSSVLSSLISAFLEFIILFALLIVFKNPFTWNILLFPIITLIYFVIIYGVGLTLGALYVFYRDLNQIWEVVLSIGFFLSPILYPVTRIPEHMLKYYMLNPVTTIMVMYRDSLLYGTTPSAWLYGYSIFIAIVLLGIGLAVFRRLQWRFAEEI